MVDQPVFQDEPAKNQKKLQEELLHTAIVECYLQLSHASRPGMPSKHVLEKEELRLRKLSNIVLMDYIKSMCDLLQTEYRKALELTPRQPPLNEGVAEEYESHMQQLEQEIRNHYSVQHQLKLHIEVMESEHETDMSLMRQQVKKLETQVNAQSLKIAELDRPKVMKTDQAI